MRTTRGWIAAALPARCWPRWCTSCRHKRVGPKTKDTEFPDIHQSGGTLSADESLYVFALPQGIDRHQRWTS